SVPSPSCLLNATTNHEIYSLSLHDALPIYFKFPNPIRLYNIKSPVKHRANHIPKTTKPKGIKKVPKTKSQGLLLPKRNTRKAWQDRKSTRLNSSHVKNSYAVFCLKKKKKQQ